MFTCRSLSAVILLPSQSQQAAAVVVAGGCGMRQGGLSSSRIPNDGPLLLALTVSGVMTDRQPSLWTRALRLAAGQPRFIKTSPKQPRQPRSPSPAGARNGAAGPETPVAAEAPDRLQAAKQPKTGAGAGAANFVIPRSGSGLKASG